MRRFVALLLCVLVNQTYGMAHKLDIEQGVEHVIARYKTRTEPELSALFKKAKVAYPPHEIALLAFKKERQVQLWAREPETGWKHIHTYPFTAWSGRLGPKLKEHDRQIPEGIYRLTAFNPYSSMHLSILINYPNGFDRLQASKDGRVHLGGNIFIHGKALSVGCLAVGDKAIEQLFYLTHQIGLQHVKLIIAPNDLRSHKPATNPFAQPRWLAELYQHIQQALRAFPIKKMAN